MGGRRRRKLHGLGQPVGHTRARTTRRTRVPSLYYCNGHAFFVSAVEDDATELAAGFWAGLGAVKGMGVYPMLPLLACGFKGKNLFVHALEQ